jgi:proteasome accessory factor C
METLYRFFKLDGLLRSRRNPLSKDFLLNELECSNATFKRLINMLRNQYNYPIRFCPEHKGYFYDQSKVIHIPGLWFSAEQLQVLLIIQQLLTRLQPSLLNDHFQSLAEQVNKLLSLTGKTAQDMAKRIQIVPIAHQYIPEKIFLPLNQGILYNNILKIQYIDISGQHTERQVSPQRLMYYRDNWYLDAWCHLRNNLRTFWIAGIISVQIVDEPAESVDEEILVKHLESSYGIFTGEATHTAHLHFTGQAAMRVRGAQWHPAQHQQNNEDGSVELWVPYSDHRELIMDILRYGSEVKVLEPRDLKAEVLERLKLTTKLYEKELQDQYVSLESVKL